MEIAMALQAEYAQLALYGGPKTRSKPWPGRQLFGAEEKAAVNDLFDRSIESGEAFGYNGPEEEAFCKEFAELLQGGFADAVNSGTSAVYVALRALLLQPFSEVIVSPITDPGGCMPVPLLNCIPIVADAAPGRYNTGPEQVEARITARTSAIVVTHVGGEPVDMAGIMRVARKHSIPVVEDCAQAHLATINGQPVGTFGDIAAFSTMHGKHFATGSQGGVVFTRNEDLYWQARQAADRGKPFGLPPGNTNVVAALNLNLGDLGAAIGRVQLRKLPGIVERRRRAVAELLEVFQGMSSVEVPEQVSGAAPSWWFWRLGVNTDALTCDKATFCQALAAEGVLLAPSYNHMPHTQQWFRERKVFGDSGLPWTSPLYKGDPKAEFECANAKAAIEKHFNLTVYESWGEAEIQAIVAAFTKVEKAFTR